jgi:hypothetical protein
MPRKNPFPPEADTKPNPRRAKAPSAPRKQESAPAPKSNRERAEAPTVPPPAKARSPFSSSPPGDRVSDVRPARKRLSAATVDEVTADLSNDPRREREDTDEP